MEIYEPQGRAREYSPLALNYFKGCDHGCVYCYVPPMMTRFNKGYEHKNVFATPDYKKIESSARKFQGCNKQILFSFTTDPYTKQNVDQTKRVLEILNFYGHKVAILSKGGNRILKDINIFKKFGDRIKVGVSITFDNYKDSKEWEHGAALPQERIDVIEILAKEGIKTWASFEPVIIPEQSLYMLKRILDVKVDHVKIGKLNNYKGIDKQIDWQKFIGQAFDILRYDFYYDDKFYFKKDLMNFASDYQKSKFSFNELNEDWLNL